MWYNITDKYLGISSYKSGLLHPNLKNECIKLSANTMLVYDIEKLKLLNEFIILIWNSIYQISINGK